LPQSGKNCYTAARQNWLFLSPLPLGGLFRCGLGSGLFGFSNDSDYSNPFTPTLSPRGEGTANDLPRK
jgi:hypothetical protein